MNRAFSVFAKSVLTTALAMSAVAHAAEAAAPAANAPAASVPAPAASVPASTPAAIVPAPAAVVPAPAAVAPAPAAVAPAPVAVVPAPVAGAVAPAANAVQKPDVTKGQSLYNTGDSSRNITACLACHGPAGNSSVPAYPKLSAQHDSYVVKQLHNFTEPVRQNPIMTPIAMAMTEQDMINVAAYLARQKAQPGAATSKEAVELGKRIYRAGIAEKNIPACASCHAPNGAGIPAQYPRLAGQHQEYTTAQLVNFRTGVRSNSAQMTVIAKRMSDEEMKAVSDYVAGLK